MTILDGKTLYKRASIKNKNFLIGLISLFVQQIVVALSVFFLEKSVSELTLGSSNVLFWFEAYIVALVFPYIPGFISRYFFDVWAIDLIGSFQRSAIPYSPYTAKDFSRIDIGKSKSAIFANTGPSLIIDGCLYIQNFLGRGLNSIMTMIAVAVVVSPLIALSYSVSLLGCVLFNVYFSGLAKYRTTLTEKARVDLTAHAFTIWPHITLGNRLSNTFWLDLFEAKFEKLLVLFKKEEIFRGFSGCSMAMISLLPTTLAMTYLIFTHRGHIAYLGVLFASSPRIFQLLTMLVDFSGLIFASSKYIGRLTVLKTFFDHEKYPENNISYNLIHIYFNQESISLKNIFLEIATLIKKGSVGRYLIKGQNGAGKTTLLLKLKDYLGSDAFYLPATSDVLVALESDHGLSTGERKRRELYVLLEDPSIKYILLDEWDANLDDKNTEKLDRMIEEISHKRTVIEVRHRKI